MVKITLKMKSPGVWCIYKDGMKVDEETSKAKAEMAAKWYRIYFRGNASTGEAHERFKRESQEQHHKEFGGVFG